MTVTIKPLAERDFFGWYGLFSTYAQSMRLQMTDEQTMRVWSALHSDAAYGVLAADESGAVVGLAHASVFTRLMQGDTSFVLEDVYVADGSRRQGVATALIEHVRTHAETERRPLRLVTRPDDAAAKALVDRFAATGDWAMADLPVG